MTPFWTVSLFWIAAIVCVAVALAFVLPALMRARGEVARADRREVNIAVYRDQLKEIEADRANGLISEAQFQSAKLELEARLADDALAPDETVEPGGGGGRALAYSLGALLPAAAFGLYFWLGSPASLSAVAQPSPDAAAMAGAPGEHDVMQMIRQVEEKTRTNPDDGMAWAMLAKTYSVMEQWPKALRAYENAARLLPQDASVLSSYAEVMAIANGRALTGKPMELVQKALEIDPDDVKALELAGINAFQGEDFEQARGYFKRLHALLPPDSPYARDIQAALQETERLAGGGAPALDALAAPPAADSASAPGGGARIAGSVDIAPALKSRLGSGDTVFLFARAGAGGPPLAAIRSTAGSLPLEFSLDDSTAMNPGNVLSQHREVMLVARISRSGNAMAQPGDFEGRISGVKVGATGVKLVIDRVLP